MADTALNLKTARAERNLTQNQLAYISEVSQVTISNIENGIVRPHQSTKEKIEEALQLPIDWARTFDEGNVKRQIISN